jgi:hypothetical protein
MRNRRGFTASDVMGGKSIRVNQDSRISSMMLPTAS